jgi:hypothetical protein
MPMALKPYLNTIMTGEKINVANLMVLESVEKKTVSCIKEIGNMDNHMVKEHNGQAAVVGTSANQERRPFARRTSRKLLRGG